MTTKEKIIAGLAIGVFFGICIAGNLLLDNYTEWLFSLYGM